MRDIINEIGNTIRHNRLRTALTGFSVAWGIFILIVLLGAGNGLINAMLSNNKRFLSNSMMVFGGNTSKAFDGLNEGREIELNDRDMLITETLFADNITSMGAEIERGGCVLTLNDNYTTGINISGVYPNDVQINKRVMLTGRFVNDKDLNDKRKCIVINSDMAKELLPHSPMSVCGKDISMDNLSFRVVGIYESEKNKMGNTAFIPFTTFRGIYGSGDKAGNLVFSFENITSEHANEEFSKSLRAALNTNHRAAPDDENSVWIWNRFLQNLNMNTATGMLTKALWVIGLLTLLSGIVGISNIMLITVKERTKEFGIRKALGAKPWSILRLIIVESVAITTFFGYIGMVTGIGANLYMDATIGHTEVDNGLFQAQMFLDPTVGIGVCVQATILMVIAGTIAGLIPARKAARTRPIEALRAE